MAMYLCCYCGAECELRPGMCPCCWRTGTYGVKVLRNEPATTSASFATSADLVRDAISSKPALPPEWEPLLPFWDRSPTSILLHGPPGSGKTTVSAVAAHRLFRSTVFLSGEEGNGPTMKLRLSRLELVSDDVVFCDGRDFGAALSMAEKMRAELLVVDSIGVVPIVSTDIRAVLARGHSLILIAHEAKDGSTYRGPGWVGHEVQLLVRSLGIEENVARVKIEKSRWGPLREVAIPL